MGTRVMGTYGFGSESARAAAQSALAAAVSPPGAAVTAEGSALSLAWEAGDSAYDAVREALGALSEAASGGHVDLTAPGKGALRCFGGDTPWAYRSAELPGGALRRIGSIAFQFERGVERAAWSARGDLAVAGMRHARGAVAVFDPAGAERLYAWTHERPDNYYGSEVVAVAFSPEGDRVVSGSCDSRAVVLDIRSGQRIAALSHPEPVRDVAWEPGAIVTIGERAALVWDSETFKLKGRLDEPDLRLLGPAAAGGFFVSRARSSIARLDAKAASLAGAIAAGPGVLAAAADGRVAFAAEKGGKVGKAITVVTGKQRAQIKLDASPVALAFAPDGALIAALEDGAVIVVEDGHVADRHRPAERFHMGTRVAASADGRVAIAAGGRRPILIDRASSSVLCAAEHIHAVVASPAGATLVLLGTRPRILDVASGTETPLPDAVRAAYSADGGLLALHDGKHVRVVESASLEERVSRKAPTIDRLILSPDGAAVIAGSWEVSVFDLTIGEARRLGKKDERCSTAVFSPDGATIAALDGQRVALFDAATLSARASLTNDASAGDHLAYSPDGGRLAIGSQDHLGVWDVATGQRRFLVKQAALALAWSPDGRTLAAGAWGVTVLYDGETGEERERLYGHLGSVHSIAFTGDGALLATAGEEGTVLLVRRAGGDREGLAGQRGSGDRQRGERNSRHER